MNKYKKGQKVEHPSYGSGEFESSHENSPAFSWVTFGEGRKRVWTSDLTLTELRFEDVKTGDKITLAVDGITVSGPVQVAYMNGVHMGTTGTSFPIIRSFGKWVDRLQREVTLTAHEPGEPEWHRAGVVHAKLNLIAPPGVPAPKYEFYVRQRNGRFMDSAGITHDPYSLTDAHIVTAFTDEVVQ